MSNVPPGSEPPAWSAPPPRPPETGWNPPAPAGAGRSNGVGLAALVLGILALVTSWIPFVGLGLAVLALILGILGLRKASRGQATNRGMSIAGVVLGGIALVIGLLLTVATVALFNNQDFRDLTDCVAAADSDADRATCERLFKQNLEE